MRHFVRFAAITCLILSITGCASSPPAPVIDRLPSSKSSTNKPLAIASKVPVNRPVYKTGDWRPDTYLVKKGDTLFSIGLEHGYDYKEIAQANNINAPYNIKVGQSLKFSALKDKVITSNNKPVATQTNGDGVEITPINNDTSTVVTTKAAQSIVVISEPKAMREVYSDEAFKKPLPLAVKAVSEKAAVVANVAATNAKPASETIKPNSQIKAEAKPETKPETKSDAKPEPKAEEKTSAESPEDIDWAWPTKGKVVANFNEASNKGVDISGTTGQAVNAAAAGKVIYSGSDLRGYGKLVIIKHNSTYLSVYAHNSQIVIKEGQQVSRGQKIAEMGNSDSNSVKLHFEIRRQGKSVDPSKYLAAN